MKTIFRLVVAFLSGTPLARGLALSGLTLALAAIVCQRYLPWWTLGGSNYPRLSLDVQAMLAMLSSIASLLLFCSATGMPNLVHRLATGHSIAVMPQGRMKLLASAGLLVVGQALLAATLAYLSFIGFPLDLPPIFWNSLRLSLFAFTLSYLVIWLLGLYRMPMTLFAGLMLVILCLFVPLQLSVTGRVDTRSFIIPILLMWGMVGGLIFNAPRLLAWSRGLAGSPSVIDPHGIAAASTMGSPVDFLLGTARPWRYAVAQIIPILIAGLFVQDAQGKLVLFVLLAALSGAASSFAPGRSRRLWLRSFTSREELYRKVEAAYLRHNAMPLLALILIFALVSGLIGYSPAQFGAGLVLLVLAAAVGNWLGLSCTSGLGWLEGGGAIVSMSLLMVGAYACAGAPLPFYAGIGIGLLLLGLTLGFRYLAIRRWAVIDWRLC
ncbi:MAG TPA: hypothetical protein VJN91_01215 [Gammaproteobacteria bacterium]|nr:hypothetical protein [Gammaproteobacteria bacterium]